LLVASVSSLVLFAPPRASAASTQFFAQGGEFQVNTYTPNAEQRPAVASDGSGNFVVVWQGTTPAVCRPRCSAAAT
jgi:hypothetical protein